MEHILSFVANLIIAFITKTGYWGIFILMTFESALIPIPSEITMPFSGYLVSTGKLNLYLVTLTGAAANLAGSALAFWLGFWGQKQIVLKFINRYGRFLLISEREYLRSEAWVRRHGDSISFFSRMLPGIRTFISLPVGVARMNFGRFCLLTLLGSLPWCFMLTYIGFVLGSNWQSMEVYYRKFEYVILLAIIVLAGWYLIHKISETRKNSGQ